MDTNIWFMATVDGTIVNENEKKYVLKFLVAVFNLHMLKKYEGTVPISMAAIQIS